MTGAGTTTTCDNHQLPESHALTRRAEHSQLPEYSQLSRFATSRFAIKGLLLNYFSPGKHGIHVHTWGDISGGCESVGTHFNPYNKTHGGPESEVRHVGDLGNIVAGSDGVSKVDIYDKIISFNGATNIIGRSLVVHAGEDDLGRGGYNDSLTTGHSGPRYACGVIGLANATST
ncbi:unnamed protein product [Rhizoctonia solani]|uniref:Superoxide dismutase [Cu-Zn] n=1 Tax=Rhizoctonia solani TaxID=456999 RepID=A0A8H3HUX4_9AGAM|nr:unnamed protein product [Rhizoctonia solani]